MTQNYPAGWYPQADGSQRYWDGAQWTSHEAPAQQQVPSDTYRLTTTPEPASQPKKPWFKRKRVIIPVAALAAMVAIGATQGGGSEVAAPQPTPTETAPVPATTAPESEESTPVAEPTEEATETAEPAPSPKPAKITYKTISSRDFKKLVKDPDAYAGKAYVIYGEVTQFDSATGTENFLANTGPKKDAVSYGYTDYDQNSWMTGTESKLSDLVEGDCFKAKVVVLGSYSYDTQIGGNTTVPMFQVNSISVYDSTDN